MNKADVKKQIQTYTSPCLFSWEAFKVENNFAVSYCHRFYLQNGKSNIRVQTLYILNIRSCLQSMNGCGELESRQNCL